MPPPIPTQALLPLGRALHDVLAGAEEATLVVRTDAGEPETLPAAHFFRSGDGLDAVDRAALAACRGRVLDVGAGAGALALPLQAAGHAVTALEIVPETARVLRARGVGDARLGDLWTFRPPERWDTVLLLMNGVALAGTPAGLPALLARLHDLAAPGGQVLLDSTELEGDGEGGVIQYQLEYDGVRGPPFPQLFVPFRRLEAAAERGGWRAEEMLREDDGRYLARLARPGGV